MRRLESAVGAPLAGGGAGALGALVAIVRGYPAGGVLVTALFLAVLAVISVSDLRERRIPNVHTYGGASAALAASALAGADAFALSALGLLIGGGVMAAAYVLGRGRLGLGDVKLSAFAGSVLGAHATPLFLLAGTALGAVAAAALLVRGRDRRSTFAYGPYLAAGAAVAALTEGPLLS